jgi:hypothetical protein
MPRSPLNPPGKAFRYMKTVEQMEAEAHEWGRWNPGFIKPSVLKGVKVTRKYVRHDNYRINKPPEVVKKGIKGPRPGQTDIALNNALKAKWLDFSIRPENNNKMLNQVYADFAREILK